MGTPSTYYVEQGKNRFLYVEDDVEYKINLKSETCSCDEDECQHIKNLKIRLILDSEDGEVELTSEQVGEVIHELRGTMDTIPDAVAEVLGVKADIPEEKISDNVFDSVYNELFECRGCRYWCDVDEASEDDEDMCAECYEDEYGNEDEDED